MNGKARVLKHRNYKCLDDETINARFDGMGVTDRSNMSYDLIRDIAYYYSHILMEEDPENYVIDAKSVYKKEDFKYEDDYWERIAYHNNILNFIRKINIELFSGNTPAQKAASVMLLIRNINPNKNNSENNDNMMEYFKPTMEEIKEIKLQNKTKKSSYKKESNKENKTEETIDICGIGGDGRVDRVKLLEDILKLTIDYAINNPVTSKYFRLNNKYAEIGISNLTKEQIQILENLNVLSKIGTLKTQKLLSNNLKSKIKDYGEVVKCSPKSQIILPNFIPNFIEKNIIVNNPKNGKKQVLIYLIDDSYSMFTRDKIMWVKTIMINRLDAIAKNKAELYIAWYVENVLEESVVVIKNKKQAIDFIEKNFFGNFNGGNTNIARTIDTVVSQIKQNKFFGHSIEGYKPQIVIINDGNDYIEKDYKVPGEIVLNSFILGQDNENLKTVTEKSKGTYVRFL